ncbi:MAG: glycogen synthase [Candidatus Liptonbacteria bacterium]|nr:glycogen synthase [Candidatus Liptonbacteria bacterium]
MRNRKGKKILFVATEAAPFVKVGGLGEVMRSLPRALGRVGYDARVMLPKYASMDLGKFPMTRIVENLRFVPDAEDPHGLFVCNVLAYEHKNGNGAYFLENLEYFEKRANVYGYADDPVRWVLFSKGVLEFLKQSSWRPEVIVASDWQTGFVPDFLKRQYAHDPALSGVKTVFAIHNIYYQGMFDHRFVSETAFDTGHSTIPEFSDPRLLQLNGMRRGILHADLITTVSPSYAKEILKPEFGEGLEELLQEKRSKLFGVLNGLDYEEFNPATDPHIPHPFSEKNLPERQKNKPKLQERFGLAQDPNAFTIGIVSRMDEQKGFELIMEIADALFENLDFQMVAVGDGDNKYRLFFQELEKKYPGRFGGHYFFDADLPRLVFAGADAVLIPSRFEPCGLVQMEAMRYGAIPIARSTGGLADSIENVSGANGVGFMFEKFNAYALLIAVVRAREAFNNKDEWAKLVRRAMKKDFSWEHSAKEYGRLFDLAHAEQPERT